MAFHKSLPCQHYYHQLMMSVVPYSFIFVLRNHSQPHETWPPVFSSESQHTIRGKIPLFELFSPSVWIRLLGKGLSSYSSHRWFGRCSVNTSNGRWGIFWLLIMTKEDTLVILWTGNGWTGDSRKPLRATLCNVCFFLSLKRIQTG